MVFRTKEHIFTKRTVPHADFPVLTFASWEELPGIRHCFTTRAGGVSEGYLASLNFRRDLYDAPENILENFRRAAGFFGRGPERIVCARQTHTANVRIVTEDDAGKGVTRERDYTDVDGLLTDVPGLILFTSHADCVPLYFYDPVRRAIALSHSGWKGTVQRIGAVTVRKMRKAFGCDPADIRAAIGPSICADCYEVSADVAEAFLDCFGRDEAADDLMKASQESLGRDNAADDLRGASQDGFGWDDAAGDLMEASRDGFGRDEIRIPAGRDPIPHILARGRRPQKYQLDLWQANARILREAGILPEHITITNLCTCENAVELFSHRATGGRRGLMGAFLMLEES